MPYLRKNSLLFTYCKYNYSYFPSLLISCYQKHKVSHFFIAQSANPSGCLAAFSCFPEITVSCMFIMQCKKVYIFRWFPYMQSQEPFPEQYMKLWLSKAMLEWFHVISSREMEASTFTRITEYQRAKPTSPPPLQCLEKRKIEIDFIPLWTSLLPFEGT